MFPRVQSVSLKYSSVAAPCAISTACPINLLFLEFARSSSSFSPFSGSRFIPVQLFLFCCGFRILVFSSAARSAVIIWPPVSSWRLCHVLFMARVSLPSFGVFCGFFSEFLEFHLLPSSAKELRNTANFHAKKECTCSSRSTAWKVHVAVIAL